MNTTRSSPSLYAGIGAVFGIVLATAGLSAGEGRDLSDWCARLPAWCVSLFAASGATGGWVAHRFRHFRSRGASWNLVRWILTCSIAGVLMGLVDVLVAGIYSNLALGALLGLFAGVSVWVTQEYLSPSGAVAKSENDER